MKGWRALGWAGLTLGVPARQAYRVLRWLVRSPGGGTAGDLDEKEYVFKECYRRKQ